MAQRQITSAEYEAMKTARLESFGQKFSDSFSNGFIAGIDYERQCHADAMHVADRLIADLQVTLDRERANRLAYSEVMCGKLQGLSDSVEKL